MSSQSHLHSGIQNIQSQLEEARDLEREREELLNFLSENVPGDVKELMVTVLSLLPSSSDSVIVTSHINSNRED